MKKKILTGLLSAILVLSSTAQAAISLDRTRIVFDQKAKITDITVTSPQDNTPILLQTWLEDSEGQKVSAPLVALPLLQRLDPGKSKKIKITTVGDTSELAQDRETLFYFNVLEVPPKVNSENSSVRLIMQAKIKLFYRPAGVNYPTKGDWQDALEVQPSGANTVTLKNPTPYHIIIMPVMNSKETMKEIILKPFDSHVYKVPGNKMNAIHLVYLSDLGATNSLLYSCNEQSCERKK